MAFRIARAADSHAKLTYNDYGVEMESADNDERCRLVLELLRDMQARKVPLDAVGIQAHIKPDVPGVSDNVFGAGFGKYLAAIRAMDLEMYLTEMDVNEDDIVFQDVLVRDGVVARTYGKFLALALADLAVKMLINWGISNRRTWLNDGPMHHRKQPDRPQRSLLFDPQYRPAPAFLVVRVSFVHTWLAMMRRIHPWEVLDDPSRVPAPRQHGGCGRSASINTGHHTKHTDAGGSAKALLQCARLRHHRGRTYAEHTFSESGH